MSRLPALCRTRFWSALLIVFLYPTPYGESLHISVAAAETGASFHSTNAPPESTSSSQTAAPAEPRTDNVSPSVLAEKLVDRAHAAAVREPRVAREVYLAALANSRWALDVTAEYAEFELRQSRKSASNQRFYSSQINLVRGFQECSKAREAFETLGEGTDEQLRRLLHVQDTLAADVLFVDEAWRRKLTDTCQGHIHEAQRLYSESKGHFNDDEVKQRAVLWALQRAADTLHLVPEELRKQWQDLADHVKDELGQADFESELIKIKIVRGTEQLRFIDGPSAVRGMAPGRYEAYVALRNQWKSLTVASHAPAGFVLSTLQAELNRFLAQYPDTPQAANVNAVRMWLQAKRTFTIHVRRVEIYPRNPLAGNANLKVRGTYDGHLFLDASCPGLTKSKPCDIPKSPDATLSWVPFAALEIDVVDAATPDAENLLSVTRTGFLDLYTVGGSHQARPDPAAPLYKIWVQLSPEDQPTAPQLP